MAVSLDHPLVADYLARLDVAAATLPTDRRIELREEIRTHLDDALAACGDDEASVRGVLDRLGDPQQIVDAERESVAAPGGAWNAPASYPTAYPGGYVQPRSPWGAMEIAAVLFLAVGSYLLPLVGTIIGVVLTWMSQAWTNREKTIATLLATVLPAILAVAAIGFFTVGARSSTTGTVVEEVVPAPAPTQSSLPAQSVGG